MEDLAKIKVFYDNFEDTQDADEFSSLLDDYFEGGDIYDLREKARSVISHVAWGDGTEAAPTSFMDKAIFSLIMAAAEKGLPDGG